MAKAWLTGLPVATRVVRWVDVMEKKKRPGRGEAEAEAGFQNIPSLRWWSSQAFMPAKDAAPAMSS